MLKQIDLDRSKVIEGLSQIRHEWEQELDGISLIEIEGNVGLLLADIADAIGLTQGEQDAALGRKLHQAVKKVTGK